MSGLVCTLAGLGLACGEPTASGIPDARLGTYVLDSLDGTPLPGTAPWNSIPHTVLADTLVLRADQTFEPRAITDGPILGFSGPTTVRGDSLFLHDPLLGGVSAAGGESPAPGCGSFRSPATHSPGTRGGIERCSRDSRGHP